MLDARTGRAARLAPFCFSRAIRCAVGLVVLASLATGCGTSDRASPTTTTTAGAGTTAQGLHIGVVGTIDIDVRGAVLDRGPLDRVASDRLVIVSAASPAAGAVPAAAAAHPQTHYALVGASARGQRLPNLAGLVIRHDQAARLGGVVAGLVVLDESGTHPRVAWVGPEDRPLATAFARGVHEIAPAAVVLRQWSANRPAACKEAALEAVARGATLVMARGGLCAEAAFAGVHQQNGLGLSLSDFELLDVTAAEIVRDAVQGIYHGGEDLVFGAESGAIAVRSLDPRISPTIAVRARAAAQQLASGRSPTG